MPSISLKPNLRIILPAVAFICLCLVPLVAGVAWYINFQSRPPSSAINDSGYYIRGSKVYYLGGFPSTAFEIGGANASTFKVIDSTYGLDDVHVYFNGSVVPDSDSSTFEVLAGYFSRDARHVYISGEIFTDDPANFEILGGNISRDSQHIYWSDKVISDDPSSLEVVGRWDFYTYLKDSTTVFVNGEVIQDADPMTFEVFSGAYSRDDADVFYFSEPIPDADSSTFEIIESPYARDADSVFWMENVIHDADPQTFRVLNADFECSMDVDHVYYQDQVIEGFDPSTLSSNVQVTNCSATELYTNP